LTIIGVHTPETQGERNVENIRKKAKENGLEYPIAVDNNSSNWKAWGNRWWPSTYLIDKKGNVRYRWDGELNYKGIKGEDIMRQKVEELLAEK
jgi:peroxiredoxin